MGIPHWGDLSRGQKIAIGGGAGVGLLWVMAQFKKPTGSAGGVLGGDTGSASGFPLLSGTYNYNTYNYGTGGDGVTPPTGGTGDLGDGQNPPPLILPPAQVPPFDPRPDPVDPPAAWVPPAAYQDPGTQSNVPVPIGAVPFPPITYAIPPPPLAPVNQQIPGTSREPVVTYNYGSGYPGGIVVPPAPPPPGSFAGVGTGLVPVIAPTPSIKEVPSAGQGLASLATDVAPGNSAGGNRAGYQQQ